MQQQQTNGDDKRMAEKREYKIFRTNLIGTVAGAKERRQNHVLRRFFLGKLDDRSLLWSLWLRSRRGLGTSSVVRVERRHVWHQYRRPEGLKVPNYRSNLVKFNLILANPALLP